jgi:thymidylate synthase
MNKLDKQYTDLLQDILDNGIEKKDRTGTGTKSVFGRQIRHKMSEGFPLLTTKKMYFKGIATELIWFLRGDTNIKYLVDNDCHIWDGDAYKNYTKSFLGHEDIPNKDWFVNEIKTNNEFAKKFGDLGPIYGKQWREWSSYVKAVPNNPYDYEYRSNSDGPIDQITNLINDLKKNPDSRRLMVNAWNVDEIDKAVLPPCHYGFQVWTRELNMNERTEIFKEKGYKVDLYPFHGDWHSEYDIYKIPRRTISLMWNQRSVDTFLGLPFNIASYGLLLEIIAEMVNMVPDELIGNLGDTHIYLNHIEQAKEQIGREPYPLPKIGFSDTCETNFKKYRGDFKNNHLGVDLGHDYGYFNDVDAIIESFVTSDFTLENYQSHPSIKASLSN